MRTKVVDGSQGGYGISSYSETSNYNNSGVKMRTNSFYASLAPTSALRQNAVLHDATSKLGVWGYLNAASGMSTPTETIATGTLDVAFALSYQEAASYCSTKYYNGGIASPSGAQSNWNRLKSKGDSGTANSWLRSIGASTNNASAFGIDGGIGSAFLTSPCYVRPALWVKSDIIDNLP